jgi:hypothetical protein
MAGSLGLPLAHGACAGRLYKQSQFARRGRAQLYKQDAHDKSPQTPIRAAFLGQYPGSARPIPTFVVRVKQSQFGASSREEGCRREQTKPIAWPCRAGRGPVVQTNPISGGPGGVCRAILRNKAKPGRAGIWGTGRRRDEHRANAPNKPNLPGGAGGEGRGMLYKQSQLPPDQKEGQVLGGKGVMVNSTFDRPAWFTTR